MAALFSHALVGGYGLVQGQEIPYMVVNLCSGEGKPGVGIVRGNAKNHA